MGSPFSVPGDSGSTGTVGTILAPLVGPTAALGAHLRRPVGRACGCTPVAQS